jgi:hypothetical protein
MYPIRCFVAWILPGLLHFLLQRTAELRVWRQKDLLEVVVLVVLWPTVVQVLVEEEFIRIQWVLSNVLLHSRWVNARRMYTLPVLLCDKFNRGRQ